MRDGRRHLQTLAEKFPEQTLDEIRRLGVGRPFLRQRAVAESAQRDRTVGQLLPVFVAVPAIDRTRETDLGRRRGRQHLQARGAHAAGERGQDFLEPPVDGDDHGVALDGAAVGDDDAGHDLAHRRRLVEQRLALPQALRQRAHARERLHDAVGRQQEPLPFRTAVRFGGETAVAQCREMLLAVGQFGRVGSDPQRTRDPHHGRHLLRPALDLAHRQAIERRGRLLAVLRYRLVEKLRQAREDEAAVAARRAAAHLAGIDPDRGHAQRGQLLERRQAGSAEAHDADVGVHRAGQPRQRTPVAVVPDRGVHAGMVAGRATEARAAQYPL